MNITAYVGDTILLPCQVSHLGNNHVNWLRIQDGLPTTLTVGYQQFSRNMRYRVTRVHHRAASDSAKRPIASGQVESWNFEIRKASVEDQGLYECYIRINAKNKIKANIHLSVKPERAKDSKQLTNYSLINCK